MEQLVLYSLLDITNNPALTMNIAPTNLILHQFKNALASMTALMYWAGMYISSSLLHVLIQCPQRQMNGLTPG